jgi:hypothetical protein
MEAITDTEVGLVVQAGPEVRPLGWATVAQTTWANQEICDICEGGPNASQMLAGYNVATGWSNFAMACVAEIPICTFGVQPPECRPCNEFDDGQACSGALPACATKGPRQGYCVPCTTKYADGCTGATPVCDDELNTCVQCVTSADCKDPNAPRCEAATNTCGPCKVDADCPAGDKCVADADAGGGRCEKPPAPPMDAGGAPHPDAGGGVDAGDDGGNGDQPGSGNSGGCGCGLVGGGGDDGGARGAAELLAIAAALGASLVARRRRSR